MFYYSPCKHYVWKETMHGPKCLGCVHPRRKEFNTSWFSKLLDKLFPHRFYSCEAEVGYEKYCPFYEERPKPEPSPEIKKALKRWKQGFIKDGANN